MSLILAIEPDRRQASVLASIGRKLGAELIIADHAEEALAALGSRVPDLILTSALLSPRDESALAARLRELDDAAAHVQTVTIPVLAKPGKRSSSSKGLFGMLRGDSGDNVIEGCAPNVFAEQVNDYLSRAAADKRANEEARAMGRERPQVPEPAQPATSELVRDFQQDSVEPAAPGADPWASEPVGNPITAEPDGPATVIIQSANVVIEPTIAVQPAYEHQPVADPAPPAYTEPTPVAYAEPTPVEVYQPPAYQQVETYEPPVQTYEPVVAEPVPAYEAPPIAEPVALEPPPAPVYEAPASTPTYEPVTQHEPIAHVDRLEQPTPTAYEAAAQPVETFEPAPIYENYSAPPAEPEPIAFQPAATENAPEEFTPPEEEESFEIELADKLDVPKPDRHVIDTAAFDASKFEAEMQAALAEFEAALAATEHVPDPVEASIEEPARLDERSSVYVDESPMPPPAPFAEIAAPPDEASAPPVELAPPPPPEVRHETPHKSFGQRLKGLFTQSHTEHTSIAPPREPEVIAPPPPTVREAVAPPPPAVVEPVAPPPPVPSWEREEPVAPLEFAPIEPAAIVPPEPPAAIFTPPAPVVAPPQPVADVVSMLAEIKRDVEQLRQNREIVAAQPDAVQPPAVAVQPPSPAAVPAPEIPDIAVEARPVKKAQPLVKQKKGKKRKARAQDEWGMFDPEKCGFAAIIQKLDEITRQSDEVS